ncbi:MAG: Gfo/Idh/MocA family oxidoreductase [Sphaerochaeta sp.]|nr:Gfo/Idh/MocA family oxidoreductase [Sphaerochaeta sp.]
MGIQIGIVGAGGMASYHCKGFAQRGAEVVCVADSNQGRAASFARDHGIRETAASMAEMLRRFPSLDALSIVTPNKFHAPLAIEALNAGKHVYCEKPPARNAAEMEAMLDASKKSGKTLMFGFNNRARPEAQAMTAYIRNGVVGRINSAQATWIRRAGIPGFGGWFTDKELSGGGPVIDLLHMMDLALHFMGYPKPKCVLASTFDDFMGNPHFKGPWGIADGTALMDVESSAHAMVTFEDGHALMVRASWAEMIEREEVSVVFQGSRAGGRVRRLFGRDGHDETSEDTCSLFTEEFGHQVNREILTNKDESMGRITNASYFIDTLLGDREPLNTPLEALTLMRITDAIYESARTNTAVLL